MRHCLLHISCLLMAIQLMACKTTLPAASAETLEAAQNTSSTTVDTQAADTAATGKNRSIPGIISVLVTVKKQGQTTEWAITKVLRSPDGRVKHNFSNVSAGYLKAYFTNDAGTTLDSNYFDNPLTRHIEAPGDNGQPATAIVKVPEGAVYLRANNNAAITKLRICSQDNTEMATFDLNEYTR